MNPRILAVILSKLFDPNQAKGDIIQYENDNVNPTFQRVPIGSNNQILAVVAGLLTYVNNLPSNLNFAGQANGDLIFFNGTWQVLHKGADSTILNIDPVTHLPTWTNPAVFTNGQSIALAWAAVGA